MKRLQFWISVVLAVHVAVFLFVLMDTLQRSAVERPISVFLVKHRVRLKRHMAILPQDFDLPEIAFDQAYDDASDDAYQGTPVESQRFIRPVNEREREPQQHPQQRDTKRLSSSTRHAETMELNAARLSTPTKRLSSSTRNAETMDLNAGRLSQALASPISNTSKPSVMSRRPTAQLSIDASEGNRSTRMRRSRVQQERVKTKAAVQTEVISRNASSLISRTARKAKSAKKRILVMAACILVDDLLASKRSLESGILRRFAIRTTTYEYTKHVFRLYISYVSPKQVNISTVKFAVPDWLNVIPVRSHTRKGETYRVNRVMQRAYDEGAHALVRVYPWTEFYMRPWFSRKMNLLRHTYPSYTGIILSFPRRMPKQASEFRFNYVFTTRTHLEIFDSFLPMALSGEEIDIWLASVYPSTFMSRGSSRQWANSSSLGDLSDGSARPRAARILTRDAAKVRTYAALAQLKKYGFKRVNSSHHEAWKQLQHNFLRKIGRATKKSKDFKRGRMRVLVVRSVSNEPSSVQHFAQWAQELGKARDTIHFALNHYQNNQSNWGQIKEMYGHLIVMERMGIRCKVGFWREIDPKFAASYDYLWLVDDDLGLEFFDWKLTRFLLQNLNPMVAQPSIMKMDRKVRSSDHRNLKFQVQLSNATHDPILARNVPFVEVMAPFLHSAFWQIVHKRLEAWSLGSVWCLDCFWSEVATVLAGQQCGHQAPLVVFDASPVVHYNEKSLGWVTKNDSEEDRKEAAAAKCYRGYLDSNRRLSHFSPELLLYAGGWRPNRNLRRFLQREFRLGSWCPRNSFFKSRNRQAYVPDTEWTIYKLLSRKDVWKAPTSVTVMS